MSQDIEREILSHEAELLKAKQKLDIKVIQRIYADDLMLTGVLGEPTCSKPAIIEEVQRVSPSARAPSRVERPFKHPLKMRTSRWQRMATPLLRTTGSS